MRSGIVGLKIWDEWEGAATMGTDDLLRVEDT